MEVIRFAELAQTPWKNGGGLTRQIATCSDGEVMLWRLSLADVTQDGAFSRFPGLCRILTVVTGAGMRLDHDAEQMTAAPWGPLRFDGALDVFGRLTAGPVSNFNLMFDPRLCDARVEVLREPSVQNFSTETAIHCLAGTPLVGSVAMQAKDTILTGSQTLTLSTGDAVLLVSVRYLVQSASTRRAIVLR